MSPYLSVPPTPVVPDAQHTCGEIDLVFEDLSQDDRLLFTALPKCLGILLWRDAFATQAATQALYKRGIVPILSRISMALGGGPVSVHQRFRGDGRFELAHTQNGVGEVDRLMLNMWVSLAGQQGQTYGPAPANDAPFSTVGTVCAEHVFTRPFAASDQRKVTRFEIDGLPAVPPTRWEWRPPLQLLTLPAGALVLDALPVIDPAPTVFALHHTDPNRHVNSLVYIRIFQDAAIRRFHAHGRNVGVTATQIDIAYRKPFFVGDSMGIALQAFELDGDLCAAGQFFALPRRADARPHATVAMRFA